MSRYQRYCTQQGLQPWASYSLACWVMALSLSKHKIKYIEGEVAGVCSYALDHQLGDLRDQGVRKALKAAGRAQGSHSQPKEPISLAMLRSMVAACTGGTAARDKAFLSVGFFGMFRGSELQGLLWHHISFHPQGAVLYVHKSKTDQTGKGAYVFLSRLPLHQLDICPVQLLSDLQRTSKGPASAVFANSATGQPLAVDTFRSTLKRLLRDTGHAAHLALYSLHSLRRGGATAAAQQGVPLRCLMEQGRWVSDAVRLYTYTSDAERWRVTQRMAEVPTAVPPAPVW